MKMQNNDSLKALPVGVDAFEDLINSNYYYVDKTPFIKTVINNDKSKFLLITRPRRFGKSLAMDTFYSFLNINDPENPQDHSYQEQIFCGTKILEDKAFCDKYMGKYPVISISFKDVDGDNFTEAYRMVANIISEVIYQFQFLLVSDKLSAIEKKSLESFFDEEALAEIANKNKVRLSLKKFSQMLYKHYGKEVVILIDEYDVPLANAYTGGYYDKMIKLIHGIFSAALKGNKALHKAVLTGCLRVSKESIFTGLNNVKVNSVTNDTGLLAECMGFNKAEVKDLLHYYDLSGHEKAVKDWYDGYRIADSEIFCPWDVINFCDTATEERRHGGKVSEPKSFWSSTSTNDVIQQFMGHLDETEAERMQRLLDGGEIEFNVNEKLNYNEIEELHRSNDFWTLLLYTGYLTAVENKNLGTEENPKVISRVRIPNKEIHEAFKSCITDYYEKDKQVLASSGKMVDSFFKGECDEIRTIIEDKLGKFISIRDLQTKSTPENFYQGFLNGVFSSESTKFKGYKSNSDAGNGYADIVFTSRNNQAAVIIELKSVKADKDKLQATLDALKQIEDKKYIQAITTDNADVKTIYCYGIAFFNKECLVRCEIKKTSA